MPRKTAPKTTPFHFRLLSFVLITLLVAVIATVLFAWHKKNTSLSNGTPRATLSGTYRENVPSADTSGRTVTLELGPDGTSVFTQDYGDNNPPIIENGTWAKKADLLTVEVGQKILDFRYISQNAGVLQLVNYDQSQWGSAGLTLQYLDSLVESEWVWVGTVMSDDTKITTDLDKSFRLRLTQDSRVNVRTDCNSGMGSYSLSGLNGLKFNPLATTLKFCLGSQENVFYKHLSEVNSYLLEDGKLSLLLQYDSGTMIFEPESVK